MASESNANQHGTSVGEHPRQGGDHLASRPIAGDLAVRLELGCD
jgi:hypothetical protein